MSSALSTNPTHARGHHGKAVARRRGFEVLRILKADPATMAIPVIVLSNLGQERDVQEALAAGAVAFIVKASLPLNEYAGRITALLGGA